MQGIKTLGGPGRNCFFSPLLLLTYATNNLLSWNWWMKSHPISSGVTRYSVLKADGDAYRLLNNTLIICMSLSIHFPIYLLTPFLLYQPTVLSSAPNTPSSTKPLSYTISYQPRQPPIHSSSYSPPSIPLQPSSLILTVNLPTALYFFCTNLAKSLSETLRIPLFKPTIIYGYTSIQSALLTFLL